MLVRSNSRSLNFVLITGIYILLVASYKISLSEFYNYRGFSYSYSFLKSVISILIFFIANYYLNYKKVSNFSYGVGCIFFILGVIPNLIVFQFQSDIFIITLFNILIIFLLFNLDKKKFKLPKAVFNKKSKKIILLILIGLSMIPFILKFKFNLNFRLFLLEDIYTAREETLNKFSTYYRYMYPTLTKIILPIGLIIGVSLKSRILSIVSLVSIVYLFLINPHKSVLFSIFVIIAFLIVRGHNKQIRFLLFVVVLILFLGRVLTSSFDLLIVESLIARRTFFVPAILNVGYFEFFANSPLFLSNSILSWLVDYPYSLPPPNMVAGYVLGDYNIHSNNGIISTGFMNFGLIGAFGNILGLVVVIKIIQSCNINSKFFGLIFLIAKTFLGASFFAMFTTHGLLVFLFLSIYILKDDQTSEKYLSSNLKTSI